MTINKAIIALAIVAVAAFAGVAVAAEDVSAADDPITVTYSYNGAEFTVNVASGVEALSFEEAFGAKAVAPAGYEFKEWSDGTATYAVDADLSKISANVTLVPVFELDNTHGEVVLTYGDVSETYLVASDEYELSAEQLAEFSEAIGIDLAVASDGTIALGPDAENVKLKSIVAKADSSTVTKLSELKSESKKTATYVFDIVPDFTVSFVVDEVTIASAQSSALVVPTNPVKANYTFVGWNDGVKTYAPESNIATVVDLSGYEFVADTTFTAVWAPVVYDVTFINGDSTDIRSAKYGGAVDAPALGDGYLGWALQGDESETLVEFPYTVLGPVTFVAVEGIPAVVYNVTFEIEGKTPVVLKSDNLVIPSTDREGYEFQGWVVKGTANYVDPLTYDYTEDVTFVAMYKQVGYSTVTFVVGDVAVEVSVKTGTVVPETEIPELDAAVYSGWNADVTAPITGDVTITAVPVVYHTATFDYGYPGLAAVTIEVADGAVIEQLPVIYDYMGAVMWTYDGTPVTADATYTLVAIPVVEEPGFLDTTKGQITAIIAVIVVLFVAALLVAPASPLYYKDVKAKVAEKKAAREAAKKP